MQLESYVHEQVGRKSPSVVQAWAKLKWVWGNIPPADKLKVLAHVCLHILHFCPMQDFFADQNGACIAQMAQR